MKTKLYYAETGLGCTLKALRVRSVNSARKEFLREVGTHAGVKEVRVATPRDIAWVKGMGGYVPEVV